MSNQLSFEELQQMVAVCIDEVVKIKQENQQLQAKNAELERLATGLLNNQKVLIENINQCFENIETNRRFVNRAIDNVRYEWQEGKIPGDDCYLVKFFDYETTIREIVKNRKSLVRFGDADFALMAGEMRQKYQHYDPELAARLKEVIRIEEEGLLVAIADNYGSLEKYNEDARQGIRSYMSREVRIEQRQYLNLERIYHNAYITRPYALHADNHTDAPRKRFEQLKRIWDGRRVIFIEGALTRLGVGNDLFDNAVEIRRIEAPATSSFDRYADILKAALQHADEEVLFLVALGPAARPLVYDLYKAGYQAVDIGHVDLEYEWFLNGTGGRSEVKNKYNNEWAGGDRVEDICDEKYQSQIIEKIY